MAQEPSDQNKEPTTSLSSPQLDSALGVVPTKALSLGTDDDSSEASFQKAFLSALNHPGDVRDIENQTRSGWTASLRVGSQTSLPIAGAEISMQKRVSVLVVTICARRFAITLSTMRNILDLDQITLVPFAPRHVAGVINMRGRVVTVVDMRVCIGADLGITEPLTHGSDKAFQRQAVTVETEQNELFSLMVDSIGETYDIFMHQLKPPPKTLSPKVFAMSRGILQTETDLIIMLDPKRLLDVISVTTGKDVPLLAG